MKNTATGSTLVIRPCAMVKPDGSFIHEFAATTDIAPRIPVSTTGTSVHRWAQGGSLSQP